jgi:putative FmdB family regulatory protein
MQKEDAMPLYEYQCDKCANRFERLVFHDEEEVFCPACSGKVHKLMSAFNVEIPDEMCGKLPRGEKRELCTECRQGGSACPLAA